MSDPSDTDAEVLSDIRTVICAIVAVVFAAGCAWTMYRSRGDWDWQEVVTVILLGSLAMDFGIAAWIGETPFTIWLGSGS